MGQERPHGLRIAAALHEAGLRAGTTAEVIGWKYFEREEWDWSTTPIAAAAFIVDAIREIVGTDGELIDATVTMMNPYDGLRSVSTADQIAVFEWAAARAS